MARFAECLIPLIDKDESKAIKIATEIINSFGNKYEKKWLDMMRNKLGLLNEEKKDKSLILDLLTWMHEKKADYTNTFCHLMRLEPEKNKIYEDIEFLNWKLRWKERLKTFNNSPKKYEKLMSSFNPLVIPRNHKVEEVLNEANKGNLEPLSSFLEVLSDPYNRKKNISKYQIVTSVNKGYQTFCGT